MGSHGIVSNLTLVKAALQVLILSLQSVRGTRQDQLGAACARQQSWQPP